MWGNNNLKTLNRYIGSSSVWKLSPKKDCIVSWIWNHRIPLSLEIEYLKYKKVIFHQDVQFGGFIFRYPAAVHRTVQIDTHRLHSKDMIQENTDEFHSKVIIQKNTDEFHYHPKRPRPRDSSKSHCPSPHTASWKSVGTSVWLNQLSRSLDEASVPVAPGPPELKTLPCPVVGRDSKTLLKRMLMASYGHFLSVKYRSFCQK